MNKARRLVLLVGFLLVTLTGRSFSAGNVPLLIYAVCKQDRETIELILENEGYSDEQTYGFFEMTALDLAIKNGLSDIAQLLMEHGAEPSRNTLYYACSRSDLSKLCRDFPRFAGHEGCAFLRSGEPWTRECATPDEWCRQILD